MLEDTIYQHFIPPIPNRYQHLFTVSQFRDFIDVYQIHDDDGTGYPVKENYYAETVIKPSTIINIPQDATHILYIPR